MIADTSFLIDIARGDTSASEKAKELTRRKEPLAISAISLFELWQGSGKLTEKELYVLTELIGRSMIILLELENAEAAGIISSQLRRKGVQISPPDCLIAGTALSGNDSLLTRNTKDFSHIEGLRVETY